MVKIICGTENTLFETVLLLYHLKRNIQTVTFIIINA